MKLEKEVDVWTAVQAYLDQDATGSLTPETEMNKPEFNQSFTLTTDASNYSMGGTLTEVQNGEESFLWQALIFMVIGLTLVVSLELIGKRSAK